MDPEWISMAHEKQIKRTLHATIEKTNGMLCEAKTESQSSLRNPCG